MEHSQNELLKYGTLSPVKWWGAENLKAFKKALDRHQPNEPRKLEPYARNPQQSK